MRAVVILLAIVSTARHKPPRGADVRSDPAMVAHDADPLAILRLMPPGLGPVPHILPLQSASFFSFGMTMSMNLP